MIYREGDFAYYHVEVSSEFSAFIDDAFAVLNSFKFAVQEYFTCRGYSDGRFKRYWEHVDGTQKVLIQVAGEEEFREGAAASQIRQDWLPGQASVGLIRIRDSYLRCLKTDFDNASLSTAARFCAISDVAITVLAHEIAHVMGRNEREASMLEGYVRHTVYVKFGVDGLCGQSAWVCGCGKEGCPDPDDLEYAQESYFSGGLGDYECAFGDS